MEQNNFEIDAQRAKELEVLRQSNEMYKETIREAKRNPKNKTPEKVKESIDLIENMREDIVKKYEMLGGNPEDLKENFKASCTPQSVYDILETHRQNNSPTIEKRDVSNFQEVMPPTSTQIERKSISQKPIPVFDELDSSIPYDVIPLPSKGECYKGKQLSHVPVSYLTASDEDLITSPNMYRDGLIFDHLLKQKIQNKTIDPDMLVAGDRDAIILWLRATGYGPEFPVTVSDPNTETEFDTIVDLTKVKAKEFKLIGDDNGWFDFKLPQSGDDIKFKYLSHSEERDLDFVQTFEDQNLKKDKLSYIIETLNNLIEFEKDLNITERSQVIQGIKSIEQWEKNINTTTDPYVHIVTNRLEMQIQAINGNTDKKFIRQYIKRMPAKDSFSLRRYILENQPGLDFNITVEKPESLGGGSIKMFLALDETLFLNIA